MPSSRNIPRICYAVGCSIAMYLLRVGIFSHMLPYYHITFSCMSHPPCYLVAGIKSDHECSNINETRRKLLKRMHIMRDKFLEGITHWQRNGINAITSTSVPPGN